MAYTKVASSIRSIAMSGSCAKVSTQLAYAKRHGFDISADLKAQLFVALAIRERRQAGYVELRRRHDAVQVRTSSS